MYGRKKGRKNDGTRTLGSEGVNAKKRPGEEGYRKGVGKPNDTVKEVRVKTGGQQCETGGNGKKDLTRLLGNVGPKHVRKEGTKGTKKGPHWK